VKLRYGYKPIKSNFNITINTSHSDQSKTFYFESGPTLKTVIFNFILLVLAVVVVVVLVVVAVVAVVVVYYITSIFII